MSYASQPSAGSMSWRNAPNLVINENVTFDQECPACGRTLRVPVVALGQMVACRHCGRHFIARDRSLPAASDGPTLSALDRAEQLLLQLDGRIS
jgi:hypothetical protein